MGCTSILIRVRGGDCGVSHQAHPQRSKSRSEAKGTCDPARSGPRWGYPVYDIKTTDPGASNIMGFALCYLSCFPHPIQNLASTGSFLPQSGQKIFSFPSVFSSPIFALLTTASSFARTPTFPAKKLPVT